MTPVTIRDHSRLWYSHQGISIPPIPELADRLHEIWVNYAFAGLRGNVPNEYGVRPGKAYFRDE